MIHELVLLCTYFNIRADRIAEVIPHTDFTVREVRRGPESGRDFEDFRRVGFTVVSRDGSKVSVRADRCGGNFSSAEVSVKGEVKSTITMPDPELEVFMKKLEAETPDCMPYFY